MSERWIRYWPILYSPNAGVQEPRHIGLIACDQAQSCCLMMGAERPGQTDPRFFCHAFGLADAVGWAYSEWVGWFYDLAKESASDKAIELELDRLAKTGSRFAAGELAYVRVPLDEKLTVSARRLFAELVSVPTLPTRSRFETAVEEAVLASEIEAAGTLHKDVELEILDPGRPVFVRLPFFVEAPVRMGIKVMRFEGTTDRDTASQANDILYSFDLLTRHGILERERCVVLHDRAPARRSQHLQRIAGSARLLLLGDPMTSVVLRQLVVQP